MRYWSKTTPRSLTLEDGETCISPTLTDKSLKFCFKSGDQKIINSVLESLLLNLFLIMATVYGLLVARTVFADILQAKGEYLAPSNQWLWVGRTHQLWMAIYLREGEKL